MTLRRPNMLRYNGWLDQCAETLANLPSQSSHDAVIVAWVGLSKITEDMYVYKHLSRSIEIRDSQINVCSFQSSKNEILD